MRAKITGKLLASLKGAFTINDQELKGLAARRQTEAGKIVYTFLYRDATGVQRRVSIGEAKVGEIGALTPDQARDAARVHAVSVAQGQSPAAARDAEREVKTLAEVWAEYCAVALHLRKPRVQVNYRVLWDKHLGPRLGVKRVDQIKRAEVEAIHKSITDLAVARVIAYVAACVLAKAPARGGRMKRPRLPKRAGGRTVANHVVELLSMLINRVDGVANPCERVERNRGRGRDIVFSDTEFDFIIAALEQFPLADQIMFGLFIETSNRHKTIAAAEWEEFADLDRDGPAWTVFGEKLKGGRPFTSYLSRHLALKLLTYKAMMREASPRYLFPFGQGKRATGNVQGFDPDRHRVTLDSNWERLRGRALELAAEAGASDLRALRLATPHIFKHTYLSRFADLGASAVEVQQAGNHTDIRTSMKYIKASGARMRELQSQMRRTG